MSLPSTLRSLFCSDPAGEPLDLERPIQYAAAPSRCRDRAPGPGGHADALSTWPPPTSWSPTSALWVGGFPSNPPTPAGLGGMVRAPRCTWARIAAAGAPCRYGDGDGLGDGACRVLASTRRSTRACHVSARALSTSPATSTARPSAAARVVTEVCVQYIHGTCWNPTASRRAAAIPARLAAVGVGATGLSSTRQTRPPVASRTPQRAITHQRPPYLWYFPPPEMMERLAHYANQHSTCIRMALLLLPGWPRSESPPPSGRGWWPSGTKRTASRTFSTRRTGHARHGAVQKSGPELPPRQPEAPCA